MPKNRFFPHKAISEIKDPLNDRTFFESSETALEKVRGVSFNWGIILMILLLLPLAYRLFKLQVDEGYINLKLSQGNIVRNIAQAAPRGAIIDQNGKVIASNMASYQLVTRINRKKDLKTVDDSVFALAQVTRGDVEKAIDGQGGQLGYVILRDKIARDDALLIKSRLPVYGPFEIIPTFLRDYVEVSLSHVLGYVGKPSQTEIDETPSIGVNGISGKDGLEKAYDQYLQGVPGSSRAEVNASNKLIRNLSTEDSLVGNTLKTTIDLDLQKKMYQELKIKTDELNTKAAAVAIDPRDGSIKAMVSLPDYDNKKFSGGLTQDELNSILNDPSKPMLNRVTAGVYPSGSSIKPFIATAALDAGVVSESTSFDTPPFIEIGQWKFPDWKDHGVTDIRRAIAESNNIFFFAMGGGYGPIKNGLGPDGMKKGLEKFGFGSKTGVDLSGEGAGFIPTPEWKKKKTGESWYIGNTYNMAIGQGDLLVTPIQIANATSTIANGGKIYKPHFADSVLASSGAEVKNFLPSDFLVASDRFNTKNLDIVKSGMRMTVTDGSAKSVFGSDFPISVAAKTGTAQFGTEDKTHAWFTSYAPYEDPKLVVTVMIEAGGEGYQSAAPVAREIFRWWAENRNK
jgi:penicillin-binding protein 2